MFLKRSGEADDSVKRVRSYIKYVCYFCTIWAYLFSLDSISDVDGHHAGVLIIATLTSTKQRK